MSQEQRDRLREEFGITESTVGGVLLAAGGDAEKAEEFLDGPEVMLIFNACPGATKKQCREALAEARNDVGDAICLLYSRLHPEPDPVPEPVIMPMPEPHPQPEPEPEPVAKPLPDKPVAKPLPDKPAAEPVSEKPAAEPVPEKPAAEPVSEKPAAEPVPEKPAAEPVPEKPVAKPLPENPAAKPLPEKPAAEPAPEKAVAKPLPEKPVAKPLPEPEKPVAEVKPEDKPEEEAKDDEVEKRKEAVKKENLKKKKLSREKRKHAAVLKELAEKKETPEKFVPVLKKRSEDLLRESNVLDKEVIPEYQIGRLPTDECEIEIVEIKGMEISYKWKIGEKLEPKKNDCICLFIHDRQYSNKYENIALLKGERSGCGSFVAPIIGWYDLRFYPNYSKVEHSRSKPFLVGPEVTVDAKIVDRRKIVVSWDIKDENKKDRTGKKDWLALYPIGTYSNTKYMQMHYVSDADTDGHITFDAPRNGEYEVRFFFEREGKATGYAYSGKSEAIVIPNDDKLEVLETHPIVKVEWQAFSTEPGRWDWIGVFPSSDDKAKYLGYEYLSKKGLKDEYCDSGVVEIEVPLLKKLSPEAVLPEAVLPEEAKDWEIRLYAKYAAKKPLLRIPFLKK